MKPNNDCITLPARLAGLCLAALLACAATCWSQQGNGAGRSTASAGAPPTDAGPIGEGVNLFTGTLGLSVDLGAVSTLSGLSFPVSLRHSGTLLAGGNLPHDAGIPYGEGWELANARITVETYAYDWTVADSLPDSSALGLRYTLPEMQARGRLFFANPRLQLPDGGGGRLVYKFPDEADPSVAVYVPASFDRYMEARFDGEDWVVRTDDGTEYVFGLMQCRERNPVGAAAHLRHNDIEPLVPQAEAVAWHLTEVRNANHANGQRIVLDYLLAGEIDMHPELGQRRAATYLANALANANYLVATQAQLDSLASNGTPPSLFCGVHHVSGDTIFYHGDTRRRVTGWRDVVLQSVTALDAQGLQMSRVELRHRTWRADVELAGRPTALRRGQFLLPGDPEVVRRDSLWSQRTIWFAGTDATESRTLNGLPRPAVGAVRQFAGWRRYMHPMALQSPMRQLMGVQAFAQGFMLDVRNPYRFYSPVPVPRNGGGTVPAGWYMGSTWALGGASDSSGTLRFTHSVLESPRLDLPALVAGDIYELRSLVRMPDPNRPNEDMTLDFRVCSGLDRARGSLNPAAHCPHAGVGAMDWQLTPEQVPGPGLGYWETGMEIRSTTREVVKWNPSWTGNGLFMATRTAFVLPNLPNEFGGLVVQAGPGSSNLNHGGTGQQGLAWPAHFLPRDGSQRELDGYEPPFGKWFGTGAPLSGHWRAGMYGVTSDTLDWGKGLRGQRRNWWSLDPRWPYNALQLTQQGASQPTALTIENLRNPLPSGATQFQAHNGTLAGAHEAPLDAELWNMELLRIARNPWMLDSVLFYGPDQDGLGDGRGVLVAGYKLGYAFAQAPLPNNLNPAADPLVTAGAGLYRTSGADTAVRNVWLLERVQRIAVDTAGRLDALAGPLTLLRYRRDDPGTPWVWEGALVAEVRNALGGRVQYQYDLGAARRAELGTAVVDLLGDRSPELLGAPGESEVRVPLVRRIEEGPAGPMQTDYTWLQPLMVFKGHAVDPHFGAGWNVFPKADRVWGYGKCVLQRPALGGGGRARTEYRHRTSTATYADTLLLGRLWEVREYDAQGALVGRTETGWAADTAYLNGNRHVRPQVALSNGLLVRTPANDVLSYEHVFLFDRRVYAGAVPEVANLLDSWFTRLASRREVDIDPVNGDSIVRTTEWTHYDWRPRLQDDPGGDYAEMHRPSSVGPWLRETPWVEPRNGAVVFLHGPEPSWQLASERSWTSAQPRAWTLRQWYWLWDAEPFFLRQGDVAGNRVEGSMRPFWLARRHGVRDALYEERTTVHDGDPRGRPVALSTYYEWDVFRNVEGDFVQEVDWTHAGNACMPGDEDPARLAVACVDTAGAVDMAAEAVAEVLDWPGTVQVADSGWWTFKAVRWAEATRLQWDGAARRQADTIAGIAGCAGGYVAGPDGSTKWFGSLHLADGRTLQATDLLVPHCNHGCQAQADSLTAASREKGAPIAFLPHRHASGEACDAIHGYADDSLLTRAMEEAAAKAAAGPPPSGGLGLRRRLACPDSSAQRQKFVDLLDWQFMLRGIHVQVDTFGNHWLNQDSAHHPSWPSPHNLWRREVTGETWQGTPVRHSWRPNYPTVKAKVVHARNMLGQVVDESDARHLHVVTEYGKGRYRMWFDSCGTAHVSIHRPHYGQPLSVTVTDFEEIGQVATMAYTRTGLLAATVSPQGAAAATTWDALGRPVEVSLNGEWRSRAAYGMWDGDEQASWNARTGMNRAEARTRVDASRQVVGVSFADPGGRLVQSFAAVKDAGAGWHKRFTGKDAVDGWGRAVASGRPYDKHNQPTLGHDAAVPGSAAATASWEASARGRVLRMAKPGNALGGQRATRMSYGIIRWARFSQETGATLAEARDIWPGLRPGGGTQVSPNVLRIHRTETVDEDGRAVISYADAMGREVASARGLAGAAAGDMAVTLYVRDAQGRVARVIRPDKREVATRHNLLGWPIEATMPGEGAVRMMYNQAGDLVVSQDAGQRVRGVYTLMAHDRMGRIVREEEAALGPCAIGNQVYWPLAYVDTLGQRHRDAFTIMDGLGRVDADWNSGPWPWGRDYGGRSFPRLAFPASNVVTASRTLRDKPVGSLGGALAPQMRAALLGVDSASYVGRVSATLVHDEDGALVEISVPIYDGEGRVVRLLRQYNGHGISQGDWGRADGIAYSYSLGGATASQSVDLGLDGREDFATLHTQDDWGRLETVRVRHRRGEDLVARYLYDDRNGSLRGVVHFGAGDGGQGGMCPAALPADTIRYTYDVQERLTRLDSRFLDYWLAYDATNVNYAGGAAPTGAAVVRQSQNWAGGVNGWKASYDVGLGAGAENPVAGFDGATVYGFAYDGLGRLVEADASVMEQPFVGPSGWNNGGGFGVPLATTRAAWMGDERYAYDKVGNLTGLRRYRYLAPGAPTAGLAGDNWTYRYAQGGDRLAELRTVSNPSVQLSYDANGNLTGDSRRGIDVTRMGRNWLPVEMSVDGGGSVQYGYGLGGRVWKRVSGGGGVAEEYYLRGADGAPVAVHATADTSWTFQIYGLGLVGEMRALASGDSVARQGQNSQDSQNFPGGVNTAGLTDSDPPGGGQPPVGLVNVVRSVALGVAVGLQQSLAQPRGTEGRPRAVELLSQFAVPVVATVVDGLVEALSCESRDASPERGMDGSGPSPERSAPDSSVYPRVKFLVTDHLGNVRVAYEAWVDDTTCTVRRRLAAVMDYSPYGGLLRAWHDEAPERWQSTGNEREAESGWDLRGARLYDAAYGRFLSRDPLEGVFPSWSPYNYVMGNPVSLTDVGGMAAEGDPKQYEKGKDGVPIVNLATVEITDRVTCRYCWLNDAIKAFNAPDYFQNDASLGGTYRTTGTYHLSEEALVWTLDAVGMMEIPVVSPLADLGSGAISFKNGDNVSGMMSVGSMVPFIGGAFTVAKYGNKARKAVNAVDEAVEAVDAVADAGKHADEVAGAAEVMPKLLKGADSYDLHHIFPQSFRKWFKDHGFPNIDDFTIQLSNMTHLRGVHGRGLGLLKGRWNSRWKTFMEANPNANPNEIWLFGEGLLREFGLEHLPYKRYR